MPKDMLPAVKQAQVVITNFHAFQLREKDKASPVNRRLRQGKNGPALNTLETEWDMLRRVTPEFTRTKNVLVINDEGHHCYRERPPHESEERETGR